jgi:hypothetical protein
MPKDNREYSELMKFCNDSTVTILDGKKSGNWIFSKYRKDTLNGLIAIYNDSAVFINDTFFMNGKTECQQFKFIDSLTVVFNLDSIYDDKTVTYKYVFGFNGAAHNWLLDYAEKREVTAEQSVYLFTDKFSRNRSMDNFSANSFCFANHSPLRYKYRKNNWLDSVVIQVNSMKSANAASFKNIFTIDHAEELLRDYPIRKTTVTSLNNIAYYLEQMSITMPAIIILEAVITDFPNRTVGYRNLSDALMKNNLKTKAKQIYNKQ